MKVQYDTGWDSLIKKSMSEKSVDKLGKTSQELSKYSSISTLTNVWTAKRLLERKDRQNLPKQHRFPPSLLTSKAADLWNTLKPLRANCSCSSVSIGDKYSRLSFRVSISDASVGSNSDSSAVSPIKESAAQKTLSNTLAYTHLAFELLTARMVRLLNILNKKSASSSTHISFDSNLKILPPLNLKSQTNSKMILRGSDNRFPSITSLSSNSSNDYPDYWSPAAGRIEKKWESLSKFEIAELKRRGKSFLSSTLLVPKTLRVTKSVLTKEELVYLLQCKKSLLSEYFQCKVDSTDFKKNLNSSEQKILIYGTQSDSRLLEDNLYQFVQFVRERKKNDAQDMLKKNVHSLETQKSNTNLTSPHNEDSQNVSSPKRRVTFSDPLAEDNTSLLNCCSSETENGILSVQSFTTIITNNVEMPRVQKIQSDTSFDSKSSSPSDSSVSLKACFANLSLKSHPTKSHDPNPDLNNFTTEQTLRKKIFTDERLDCAQPEYNDEIESLENSPCHYASDVEMEEKKLGEERYVPKPLLQELSLSGITEDIDQQFSDSVYDRPLLPSAKTVTFKDCCKTISEQSITTDQKEIQPLLQFEDICVTSSESKGRFELSWKGCWDRQCTKKFVQNKSHLDANSTEDEKKLVESNLAEISSESIVSMPIKIQRVELEEFSDNHELLAGISDSQTSYYTTMEGDIQLANSYRLRRRKGNLRDTFLSSYLPSSNSPSFEAVASRLEKNEMIPWMIHSSDKPASKLNYDYESNLEAKKLHHTETRKGLGNAYSSFINPEIWRSEVRSKATDLYKSDWYTRRSCGKYLPEKSEIKRDWLIRKLEELQSSPETDYESDYYAESEMESDFECEKDLSQIRRSFSNLDKDYQNYRKFNMKRNRYRRNLFLNKVWSGKKIIFNECRCHKNIPSNRYDLRPKEHDLRYKSLQESDQRSNQNFFSHLRARLILDSETDDSDFAPSIQPDFRYEFNHKNEHVNKIKCRRFVRSLRSIRSEEDRQFSSARLLHMTFQESLSPESLQSALSTRTVGTNICEKPNFCNMMDVCIDTYDLCSPKQIGTMNEASELLFLNKTQSCQTVESFFDTLNAIQHTKSVTQASPIFADRNTPSGSIPQIPRNNEQTISSTLENLSTHINNASNNLAKLRFSEIKTEPETLIPSPVATEDNSITTSHIPSCSSVLLHFSEPVNTLPTVQNSTKISSNFLNNSNHSSIKESSCPICNTRKEPGRYVRPACVVKGGGPGLKTNEKDPWNRVMEQAKAQRQYERENTSACSEIKPSSKRSRNLFSANESVYSKSFERKQDFFASDQAPKEEVRIQLVQVKNNSSQAAVCNDVGLSGVIDKIYSPPLNGSKPFRFPPASALCSSTSYDSTASFNLPRKRLTRKTKNPQTITNMSNRLLYIISENAELTHQTPIKSPAANFFN